MNQEFVDLRRSELSSESFWPSFTDIMMVVVIIFLLTSVLLMVKNWELLEQLRHSMAAEQQAEQIMHDTSRENASLEEQLSQAQNEIAMLRLNMMQANDHAIQLNLELEEKEKQIVVILSEKEQLTETLSENDKEIALLNTRVSVLQEDVGRLNADFESTRKQLQDEKQKLVIITRERDSKAQKLSALEDDFGSLKVKYDKLIMPARTSKGKHVVVVDYERVNGKERIRFRDSADSQYTQLTEQQLHNKLEALRKKYNDKLYVRIIIPEKSGLTYNEAWNFMIGILKKYDYYYQQESAQANQP